MAIPATGAALRDKVVVILVPTIPSTGTHFMRDHLLEYEHKFVEHIWPDQMDRWADRMQGTKSIIVPLRHPSKVALSWKAREHFGRPPVMDLPMWWRRLVGMIDPARPYYLPIDQVELRDSCLEHINKNLALELRTDWRIVREKNSEAAGRLDVVGLTSEEYEICVLNIMVELEPFFSRWYTRPEP